MREILFKGFTPNKNGKQIITLNGKDIRGDWVEGFVLKLTETRWAITDYYPVNPHSGAFANKHFNTGDMIIKLYEIIPQTLCQFTGKTDRKNRRIFENDTLQGYKYPYMLNGAINYYAEVFWDEECSAHAICTLKAPKADVVGISDGISNLMYSWNNNDWEIIGDTFNTKSVE